MLQDKAVKSAIRRCPICGTSPRIRQNASKNFQLYCPQCGFNGKWGDKISAVVDWYNQAERHDKQ